MDDDWDDVPVAPPQFMGKQGFASEGGINFSSRGRGFSVKPSIVGNGSDDWGSSGGFGNDGNRDHIGRKSGFRGGRDNDVGDNSWENTDNDWSSGGGGDDRPQRGGKDGFRRGRGNNVGDSSWGNSRNNWGSAGDDSCLPRGGDGDNNTNNGDLWSKSNNDGSWGDRGGSRRGGRSGRGGGQKYGNADGGWDENGDADGNGFERGRGGRRGNRSNQHANGEIENEPPKSREIYIPPEPTTDENELFHSGNTSGINFSKYDEIEVQVSGENVPRPISSFATSGLRTLILENIEKSGYTKPTPVQKYAIPIIMAGRDLMSCAQTGSGKTAAFLLPIINTLLAEPQDLVYDGEHSEPQAIIVSPTRELAIQIYDECRKFSHHSCIKVVLAYGGTSVGYQRKHILSGCHILVATPGRLHDFVKRGSISFNSTRFVVLDEADRMLDMGFLSSMEEMLNHSTMTPTGERRTLMFSATFPEEVQRLAGKFLENYIFVAVGIVGGACTDVEQVFYQVDKFSKRNKLVEIFKEQGTERTLVFVETKRNADFLATYLSENDFQTTSIHGDRQQREREEALRDFKRGTRNILVATAVAARGLDIKNVKHVINYDLPKDIDEYVHRIGRTGRVGNRGKASSFFDESHDSAIAPNLSRILKQAGQPVPTWLECGGGGSYRSGQSFGGRDVRADDFGQPKAVEIEEEEW